jgi:hypothetical protein
MSDLATLGDYALEIRSKNAGPFWVTMEAFIFRIPALNVVKISFPRSVSQASLRDRDIHGGQHHVPLACLAVRAGIATS